VHKEIYNWSKEYQCFGLKITVVNLITLCDHEVTSNAQFCNSYTCSAF